MYLQLEHGWELPVLRKTLFAVEGVFAAIVVCYLWGFMLWTKLQILILAHPWEFLFGAVYMAAAAVNALNQQWDGFYNWFYRFTHILMNARIVQTVESKFGGAPTIEPVAANVVIKETK